MPVDGKELEIRVRNDQFYMGIELLARTFDHTTRTYAVATKIDFEDVPESKVGMRVEPFAFLDEMEAQTLMNDLWRCGLRPSEEVGSVGELRAVKYHLEDMRRLVFETEGPLDEVRLENRAR
jgi:hypothetical protein